MPQGHAPQAPRAAHPALSPSASHHGGPQQRFSRAARVAGSRARALRDARTARVVMGCVKIGVDWGFGVILCTMGSVAYSGFPDSGHYCWQDLFMARRFRRVDRASAMLLPRNMLDWVPEGHAVRVVISTVERLATRDLIDRLVPSAPAGSAAGPARYDPVLLLAVWMYACLRGVLSTRAVEDRCRYDATFRVACGRQVPDHTAFSRFRRHLLAREHLAEGLSCQVLHVCACAGPGRLGVVAGGGVKIAATASKEASRAEAGLRKLAAQVMDGARKAAAGDEALEPPRPGTDLLPGADMAPGPDPRSRAGRIAACLEELRGGREAAGAHAREPGRACLEALAAGTAAAGRPRPRWRWPRASCGWRWPSPPGRPCRRTGGHAGPPGRRAAGSPPARPGTGKKARRARARPEGLQAAAAAEAEKEPAGAGPGKARAAAAQRHRPGLPADAGARRRVHPGL
jgi:transposase